MKMAALPPTPIRNRRPLRSRSPSSPEPRSSIEANEISRQICAAAAKKPSAWFIRLTASDCVGIRALLPYPPFDLKCLINSNRKLSIAGWPERRVKVGVALDRVGHREVINNAGARSHPPVGPRGRGFLHERANGRGQRAGILRRHHQAGIAKDERCVPDVCRNRREAARHSLRKRV